MRGQLTRETDAATGRVLDHHFDAFGRPAGYTFTDPLVPAASSAAVYHYHPPTGRLNAIDSGGRTVTYGYDDATGWLATTTNGPLVATRTPDSHGRLKSLVTTRGATVVAGTTYEYDRLNDPRKLRWSATNQGFPSWSYEYNDKNELIAAGNGDDYFWYQYDEAGNRTQASFWNYAPNATDTRDWTSAYSVNSLNQYTAREVPPIAEVRGQVSPFAANAPRPNVTVNGLPVFLNARGQFYKQVPVANTPAWQPINVAAAKPGNPDTIDTKSGHLFVPASPETFVYDDDGNLIQDSRWNYTWDAENRLVQILTRTEVTALGVSPLQLRFAYDAFNRRVQKHTERGVDPAESRIRSFHYVRWNLIADYTHGPGVQDYDVVNTYLWGFEADGSGLGAASPGTLLESRSRSESDGAWRNQVYGYDPSGTVVFSCPLQGGAIFSRISRMGHLVKQ